MIYYTETNLNTEAKQAKIIHLLFRHCNWQSCFGVPVWYSRELEYPAAAWNTSVLYPMQREIHSIVVFEFTQYGGGGGGNSVINWLVTWYKSSLQSRYNRDFKMLGRRRRLKRDINFSIWEKLQWIDTWSLFNEFNNDLVLRKQL